VRFTSSPDVDTLIAVGCAAAAFVARIVTEERSVVRTYPEYANYAQRTKRLFPWLF
jgi:protein-S-isoprenylcysteine O-methyltransferase Ste14